MPPGPLHQATVTLQQAHNDDLPEIERLLDSCGLPQAGLAGQIDHCLVVRDDGHIVGSAAVEPYGTAGLLRSVAVDERYRGTGLGQRLVESAVSLAQVEGLERIYLLTETAADFFPRFGFRLIERAEVEPAIQQSIEFREACPESAQAMLLTLSRVAEKGVEHLDPLPGPRGFEDRCAARKDVAAAARDQ